MCHLKNKNVRVTAVTVIKENGGKEMMLTFRAKYELQISYRQSVKFAASNYLFYTLSRHSSTRVDHLSGRDEKLFFPEIFRISFN
jgi:hypothetical protein